MRRAGSIRAAGLLAVLAALAAAPAAAQVTGRVEGTVVDAQTGEPLVGGLVIVESTNLGNVTREDGSFFINGVPVGLHKIRAEYLGYSAVSQSRRILAGQTVALDFRMPSDMITTNAIVAVVAHVPWTPPPPEKVVTREPPPGRELAVSPGFRCSARGVVHGAYIERGRWELMTSVQDVACHDLAPPPKEPTPCDLAPDPGIVRVTSSSPPETPGGAPRR